VKKYSYLIIIFLFFFNTIAKADDIKDFEIEGMSIGDSLLQYKSLNEIKLGTDEKIYSYKKDKKFVQANFDTKLTSDTYEVVLIEYKKNDKNYTIYGLTGKIISSYKNDMKGCYKKQDKVFDELAKLFINQKIISKGRTVSHQADKSGKSKVRLSSLKFSQGDYVLVACYDWHKDMPYESNFKINLFSEELNNWLIN